MAIKSGLRYWLVCDGCGMEHDDEYVYRTPEDALNACDCDWETTDDGKDVCHDCQIKRSNVEVEGSDDDA